MNQLLRSCDLLTEITDGRVIIQNKHTFSGTIKIDSRDVKPGDLFIPIKGGRFDGHRFINGLPSGVAVLTEDESLLPPEALFVIRVNDTLDAFHTIARKNRELFKAPVIGITGSNGKTSTKELLYQLLNRAGFHPFASYKNFNNQIGVPLNLLKLNQTYDCAIIEMGTSIPGEIDILTSIVRPDVALITTIAPAHLEGFGSIEGILKEKSAVFNYGAQKVVNSDNQYLKEYVDQHQDILTIGIDSFCDLKIQNVTYINDGYQVSCLWKDLLYQFYIGVEGEHNVSNLVTGIGALLHIGFDPKTLFQAADQLKYQIEGRLTTYHHRDDVVFYDDSYNANYGSIEAGILFFDQKKHHKKVVVIGEIGELGDYSVYYHRKVGELLSQYSGYYIYLLGAEMKAAADLLGDRDKILWSTDLNIIIKDLERMVETEGDIGIYIKGSRKNHLENMINYFKERSNVL